MDFDFTEVLKLITFAGIIGALISLLIQKLKELITLNNANWWTLITFVVTMTLGTFTAHELSKYILSPYGWEECIWIGAIAWLGAEGVYRIFSGKGMPTATEIASHTEDDKVD